MRIAVIGAGAMGSVFGAKLQAPGVEVVLHDINAQHIEAIRKSGLILGDGSGERVVRIAATADIREVRDADLALVVVDSNATAAVAPLLPEVLARDGMALTLQNGIGNVEALVAALGPVRVVAGATFNSAAFVTPGRVRHTNVGPTVIGLCAGPPTDRVRALARQLTAAGFPTETSDNAMGHVWSKFVLNCAINPVTALTGLRAGELMRHPPTAHLLECLLDEILAVAAAKGIRLPDPDLRRHVLDHAFERYNRPSMLQHVESGRRTEIEALNGAVVREAKALGVPVPRNETIWAAVSGIDVRHARERVSPDLDEAALEKQARREARAAASTKTQAP
ncbi:MAG TPA: ketopantoate reductase family protein [Methylomirabilota bacterium]|nr:ketopantoate reductase family protein [Methylomirabilota bacterium]